MCDEVFVVSVMAKKEESYFSDVGLVKLYIYTHMGMYLYIWKTVF